MATKSSGKSLQKPLFGACLVPLSIFQWENPDAVDLHQHLVCVESWLIDEPKQLHNNFDPYQH